MMLKQDKKDALRLRRALWLLLASAILLSALAGCTVSREKAQLKAGQKLMREYLFGLGRDARLIESHVLFLRPDEEDPLMTDYVMGSFTNGGEAYDFAVNTVTGQIWTSENLALFTAKSIRMIETSLGLDPDACSAVLNLTQQVKPWQEDDEAQSSEMVYLGNVLPVNVTDLDAYAEAAVADETIRVLYYIVCQGETLSAGRWTLADTEQWREIEVTLYAIGADEPLPDPLTISRRYIGNYPGERAILRHDDVFYRHAEKD